MAKAKDFKFCTRVDYEKCQPCDVHLSPVWAWSVSRDQFLNFTPCEISLERLKLESSNFVHWLAKRSISLDITISLSNECGQGHMTF